MSDKPFISHSHVIHILARDRAFFISLMVAALSHLLSWNLLPRTDGLNFVLPSAIIMMAHLALHPNHSLIKIAIFNLALTSINYFAIVNHPHPLAEPLTQTVQLLLWAKLIQWRKIDAHSDQLSMLNWITLIAFSSLASSSTGAIIFHLLAKRNSSDEFTAAQIWFVRDIFSCFLVFTYCLFLMQWQRLNSSGNKISWRETFVVASALASIIYLTLHLIEYPFLVIAIPATLIALHFNLAQTALIIYFSVIITWALFSLNMLQLKTSQFDSPISGIMAMAAAFIFPQISGVAMNEVRNRQREVTKLSERLNLATESNGLGVWEWDIKHNEMIWDQQMRVLYGLNEQFAHLNHQDWLKLVEPTDSAKLAAALQNASEGQVDSPIEFKIITPNGKKIIRSTATPIKNSAGQIIKVIGINSDITSSYYADILTEQKNRIAKLAQNEFAKLFELAPGPMLLTDDRSEIRKANSAAHELFHIKNGSLIGHTLTDIFPDYSLNDILSSHQKSTLKLSIHGDNDVSRKRKINYFEIEIQSQNIIHNNESLYIISMRDLSEQKEAERAISAARLEAEKANDAKSEFVANMSHEIRTPLNATLGTVKLLQNTKLTDLQLNYLQMIQNSGESLLAILNDILDISKIEAGRMELSPIHFHLEEVMQRISSIMMINAGDKDLELVIHIAKDVPLDLFGDPLRLQQILINLVSNAIKFTEKGYILLNVVTIATDHDHLVLGFSVEDTGIGISPSKQHKLFSAFTQADNSVTRKYGGTGLGLLISKRLVEMMGGTITLESELGNGSVFSFTISLIASDESNNFVPLKHRHRVLVIDPSPVQAQSLQASLNRFGYDFHRVLTIKDGIEYLIQHQNQTPFDTILLSGRQESPNQPQLHLQLKELNLRHNLSIITIGQNSLRESLNEQVKSKSIDAALVQPVTITNLDHALNEAVARRSGIDVPVHGEALDQTPYLQELKLLLVEDNGMNQAVAKGLLEQYGATVEIAEDGQQAIDVLQQYPNKYDCILMDIQMPIMDGFTATQIARQELGINAPILAMTAGVMESEKNRCLEAGMVDFVAKPIQVEDMLNAILKAVGRPLVGELLQQGLPHHEQGSRVFNPENLLKFVKGNPQRYNSIVQMIANVVGREKLPLKHSLEAYQSGHKDEARRMIHTLKGSMGNIGAMEVWSATQKLEEALIERETDNQIVPLFRELEDSLDRMLLAAKSWLQVHRQNLANNKIEYNEKSFNLELEHFKNLLSENNMEAFDVYDQLRPHIHSKLEQAEQELLEFYIQNLQFNQAIKILHGFGV